MTLATSDIPCKCDGTSAMVWALKGGGVPVVPVDFKKWQCRMSLSLVYAHVDRRI